MKRQAWLVPTLLALGVPFTGYAQSPSPSGSFSDQSGDEEVVKLSVFEVSDNRASPYRATESLGGARIRRNLIDTSASINVITSDFIQDIGASSIIDATQYISGVSYGALSGMNGLFTRQVVRGFEIFEVTFDGFTNMGGFAPGIEPEIIERIETIKGPHALLTPAGQPGGTSNLVTKSPQFEAQRTIKYELADKHFGDKAVIDATGPLIGDTLAYRLVATDQDSGSTVPGRIKNRTLNPMLTWRISPDTQVKLKGYIIDWGTSGAVAANFNNMRLRDDFTPGATATVADIHPDYEYGGANGAPEWIKRATRLGRTTGEFMTKFGDHINLKIGAVYQYYHFHSLGGGLSLNRPGEAGTNTRDPISGIYTPNDHWQITDPTQPWNATTNPYYSTPIDRTIAGASLTEFFNQIWIEETTFQFDLVGNWDLGAGADPFAKLQVVTGASRSRVWNHGKNWDKPHQVLFGQAQDHWGYKFPLAPIPSQLPYDMDLTNFTYANGVPQPLGNPIQVIESWDNGTIKSQAYLNANLDLLQGKLLLNGGLAHIRTKTLGNRSWNRNPYTLAVTEGASSGSKAPSKTSPSFSALYKVTPWASVYGSVAKNAQAGSYYDGNGNTNITVPVWREGEQNEVGVKMEFLNQRLLVTAALYDLKQTNINVAHPDRKPNTAEENLSLPDLLFDVDNKGFEFDIVGQITPELNILASYTDMKLRDQLDRGRAGTPDRMYNALLRYGFSKGPVKGLSLSIGLNHVDKQPGAHPAGNYTNEGTVIPTDFYQPARTIYNAGATYAYKSVRFQLNIDNLFDKKTIYQTSGWTSIGAYPERNIRLTTSFSF